jgi:hypothetical protein
MKIKNLRTKSKLRSLATKGVTSVALHDFNSVEEINEFARNVKSEFESENKKFDQLKKVLAVTHRIITATITRLRTKSTDAPKKSEDLKTEFVKPNMDKLKSAFEVVDKYQDKIDSLDNVINVLNLEFKGERGTPASLKQLKELRGTIKKKLDLAYKFLSDLAKNHEPKSFRTLVDSVTNVILETYSGNYGGVKHIVYMTPQTIKDNDNLLISHYVEFKDFEGDDFTHPSYYLVINGLVNLKSASINYYVNTLQSFSQPGRAGLGVAVNDAKDAKQQALIMLDLAGFSSLVDRVAIPTSKEKLDRINWSTPSDWLKKGGIKLIDHDIITVEFTNKVNDSNIQDAMNHFITDLKTSIIPNNFRMQVKKRKYKSGKNYVADFIFVLPDAHQRKEIRFDATKVNTLKDMFGISDKQAGEMIKHFNSM